jgi:hypothetical protein
LIVLYPPFRGAGGRKEFEELTQTLSAVALAKAEFHRGITEDHRGGVDIVYDTIEQQYKQNKFHLYNKY